MATMPRPSQAGKSSSSDWVQNNRFGDRCKTFWLLSKNVFTQINSIAVFAPFAAGASVDRRHARDGCRPLKGCLPARAGMSMVKSQVRIATSDVSEAGRARLASDKKCRPAGAITSYGTQARPAQESPARLKRQSIPARPRARAKRYRWQALSTLIFLKGGAMRQSYSGLSGRRHVCLFGRGLPGVSPPTRHHNNRDSVRQSLARSWAIDGDRPSTGIPSLFAPLSRDRPCQAVPAAVRR